MYNLQLIQDTISFCEEDWDVLFTPRRSHKVGALRGIPLAPALRSARPAPFLQHCDARWHRRRWHPESPGGMLPNRAI
jgi:hypothetical protein